MTTIHLIRVRLHIDEPWCIGAPESASSSGRLPTATDPFGTVVVPASSIAGSLRHHIAQHEELDVTAIMGGPGEHDDLTPSAVRVLGVEVHLPAGKAITERSQTAIDATRGAAANNMLRTSEMAPASTELTVDLRIDGHHDWSSDFLLALTNWTPFIGRARTSGMGAAHVVSVHYGNLNLANSDDLERWLTSGGPQLVADVAQQSLAGASKHQSGVQLPLDEPLRWTTRDAVLIGGEQVRSARLPYTRDGHSVIEGSSWKGVLRSRVGFVARSLGLTTCSESTGCDAPECPLCLLFGSTTRRATLRTQSSIILPSRSVTRHHVAIDRFTGGATDGLLFEERDLPLDAKLVLELTWQQGQPPSWARALVAAALLDLHDGYAGLGAKTTSGYGTVQLDAIVADQLRALLRLEHGDWIADLEAWQHRQHANREESLT